MVFPYVGVWARYEFLFRDLFLLQFVLTFLNKFGFNEWVVWFWNPFVISKQATACEIYNFSLGLLERQILVLLVSERFCDLVRSQIGWQVSQWCPIADPEALLDRVLLFVCEIIQQLCQVRQLIMFDRSVDWNLRCCILLIRKTLLKLLLAWFLLHLLSINSNFGG